VNNEANLVSLPDDSQALKAILRTLMRERDDEKRRADKHEQLDEEQSRRANDLHVENLRLQLELDRYRKWYYGPRADRLQSSADLTQMLLIFAEEMDLKPVNPDDLPPRTEAQEELRRVKRRKGRRNLANFENLPVTTQVHELSTAERACPCCGIERKEIGTDESWQVEYLPGHFERIHHLRRKYACADCESNGNNPQMETAAKPEMAIDKGMAGPGLLAYIVTSKFSDYVGFPVMWRSASVWA
jgi:transposase